MHRNLVRVLLVIVTAPLAAQTTAALTKDLRWRNIGPANMMGRIASIDALDADYRTVLVASASGGVFKSTNAGVTWKAIFDDYGAGSIGAAVFFQPDPNIIWVGTGEAANRNSSGWGDGIYKSTNGGRTFTNMGLRDTHQIAEIAVHPTDPDIVYVAAIGHLWGYQGSRGIYKTQDGGQTWRELVNGLPNDVETGGADIEIDRVNPDVLYAGLYHRIRKPWSMRSGGANGGIFKSSDAGKTWRKLTRGLPTGSTGQIDISIHRRDPSILVAAVEADERLPDGVPGSGVYRSDDGGETWRFLLEHHIRPFYHGQIEIDPQDPQRIYVVSRDFRVSKDGGAKFVERWWPGGGDDHDMWISPTDSSVWYNATDQGAQLTVDGGKTITFLNNMAIGQYYAIGVDMRDPYWVAGGLQDNGLWLGPSNSREPRGILNMHNSWIGEGDGFHTQIDPTDWRTIYIVNHVGFAARLNAETREHAFITPTPETIVNFKDVVDPNFDETPTRYTISPGEHWFFGRNPRRPKLPPQFRFNWSSPLVLSPHNPRTVFFGSNYLFRSVDRGATWRIISPDLTTNDKARRNPSNQGGLTRNVTGGENYCTIITIGQSPVDPAVVWVGTDDGNVQVTRNAGVSWKNVVDTIPGVPQGTWVSRVSPSRFTAGKAYVTFDNHRRDDNAAYVYVTENFGATWRDISANIPDGGSAYVIREDPINPRLLFVGTEFAVFASVDAGGSWARLMTGMPTVAMHDLVIHPREGDLICGTHGRSIWILDDITPLRQMTKTVAQKKAHLFEIRRATHWLSIRLGRKQPNFMFRGKNPPRGALINFYLAEDSGDVRVEIADVLGRRVHTTRARSADKGINRLRWDLRVTPAPTEIARFRQRLIGVVDRLLSRVDPEQRDKLRALRGQLADAESSRSLNTLRGRLVADYATFANGKPLFGPRLGRSTATAGDYRVTLIVDGEAVGSEKLVIREDPLKSK
ncbi:MAG: hypothetical protein CMJ83_15430 [Planctomycetes bacterium]|nr:hypothetical protein [Planctomycetota bacterium]